MSYTGKVIQIACGSDHSLALLEDGIVKCWGNDVFGQAVGKNFLPQKVIQIACGGSHSLALLEDGTVKCWGRNKYEEAPLEGIIFEQTIYTSWWDWNNIDEHVKKTIQVIQIAAGGSHSLALLEDGTVECWGWNDAEQAPPEGKSFLPQKVIQIAAGEFHSLALLDDGTVKCWGRNNFNQAPPEGKSFSPDNKAIQIACGGFHSLALLEDGTVKCWGRDNFNQAPPEGKSFLPAPEPEPEPEPEPAPEPEPIQTSTCSICLLDKNYNITGDSVNRVKVLPCGHTFHNHCITESRKTSNKCPLCNIPATNVGNIFLGGNYKEKYLKYKNKYIALKNNSSK